MEHECSRVISPAPKQVFGLASFGLGKFGSVLSCARARLRDYRANQVGK